MKDSVTDRRIKMFRRGNIACPICLENFSEDDVRRPERANLEHVPAKALKKRAAPIDMCFTWPEARRAFGLFLAVRTCARRTGCACTRHPPATRLSASLDVSDHPVQVADDVTATFDKVASSAN